MKALGYIALILTVVIAFAAVQLNYFRALPLDCEGATYIVAPGTSFNTLARELEQTDVIPSARALTLLARVQNKTGAVQAGEYHIVRGTTLPQLLNKMVQGDVVIHRLRIGEGWTVADIAEQIQSHPAVEKTLDWTDAQNILNQLNLNCIDAEGMFYPETYHFARGRSDAQFLTHAYQAMQDYLQTAWQGRDEELPFDEPYQALIAASIIEKETAVESERTEIAGVIVRRLQQGMRLQVDPTVIYGRDGDYDNPITRSDLQTDTPYNTYTRDGLPPTPIAIPSPASIDAALHPKPGDSLYFVAKGDGSHVFSATLEEHNAAVLDYRKLQQEAEDAQ